MIDMSAHENSLCDNEEQKIDALISMLVEAEAESPAGHELSADMETCLHVAALPGLPKLVEQLVDRAVGNDRGIHREDREAKIDGVFSSQLAWTISRKLDVLEDTERGLTSNT